MNKKIIITILLALIPQTEVEACLHLRLPRHPDEGKHHSNDCFLVYHRFAYIVIRFIIYTTFLRKYLARDILFNLL